MAQKKPQAENHGELNSISFKPELEQLCTTLTGYECKVLNSHSGTIYSVPGQSPEHSVFAAVEDYARF